MDDQTEHLDQADEDILTGFRRGSGGCSGRGKGARNPRSKYWFLLFPLLQNLANPVVGAEQQRCGFLKLS